MYCKTCGEPCAPQFDYCYTHRERRTKIMSGDATTVGDLRKFLEPFTDECGITPVTTQYTYVKRGYITIKINTLR